MDLGDTDNPIISHYMEDEFGRSITPGIKAVLCRDLYCYWNDLSYSDPNDLHNHKELGLKHKEYFCQTFEEKYPWLCPCKAHWKVDQLWVSYFSIWKLPCNTPDPKMRQLTPTSMSANKATSPAPVGSKCRFEEPENLAEYPSKWHKGKDRDILMEPTTFIHTRPMPRKKVSKKMTQVCLPCICLM